MYPLCITTMEKELISGDGLNQGDIVQIDEAVQMYDSDTDYTLAIELANSGEAIGVFELHKDFIISKTNQKEVMAGQVYKDKATLKEVMNNYAIAQRFQFCVDRSNAVRFDVCLTLLYLVVVVCILQIMNTFENLYLFSVLNNMYSGVFYY